MKNTKDQVVVTLRSFKKAYWDIRGGIASVSLKKITKEEVKKRQDFWKIPWYVDETVFQLWGKKDLQPELVKRIRKTNGWEFIFTLPPGYCDDDFNNATKYFYTGVGRRTLDVIIEGEAIHLTIAAERLPGKTPFIWEWSGHVDKILPLLCGLSVHGNKVIDLSKAPHILIWGETGIGKSTLLRVIITALLMARDNFELYIIDRKGGSDFYFCQNHTEVLIKPEEISDALDYMLKEMRKRDALRASIGADSIDLYNEKTNSNLPHIILIIDEYAQITKFKDITEKVDDLLCLSRASGFNLIVCSQRTTRDMSEKIGSLKINCPVKIGFGLDGLNSRLLFDSDRGSLVPAMIGRGLLKHERNFTEFQVPFLDTDKAVRLMKNVPARKVSYHRKSPRVLPPPKQTRVKRNRGLPGNGNTANSATP